MLGNSGKWRSNCISYRHSVSKRYEQSLCLSNGKQFYKNPVGPQIYVYNIFIQITIFWGTKSSFQFMQMRYRVRKGNLMVSKLVPTQKRRGLLPCSIKADRSRFVFIRQHPIPNLIASRSMVPVISLRTDSGTL
jgi:hypothetical protein